MSLISYLILSNQRLVNWLFLEQSVLTLILDFFSKTSRSLLVSIKIPISLMSWYRFFSPSILAEMNPLGLWYLGEERQLMEFMESMVSIKLWSYSLRKSLTCFCVYRRILWFSVSLACEDLLRSYQTSFCYDSISSITL